MTRLAILIGPRLSPVGEALAALPGVDAVLARNEADLVARVPELDALIIQNVTYTPALAAAVAATRRVRWMQAVSAGVDAFLRLGVPEGIRLTNAGEVWAPTVAEHALTLLLTMARQMPFIERQRQARHWASAALTDRSVSLVDRTLVIIGAGAIGRETAARAKPFGMRVVGINRAARPPAPGFDVMAGLDQLHHWLAQADAVVLAMPLNAETRHMIGPAELAAMRPGAFLINVARGQVLDQEALIAALDEGRLRGVGLDVTEPEPLPPTSRLWDFERVVVTPHMAICTDGAVTARLTALCRDNLERFIAGRPLRNEITLPPR